MNNNSHFAISNRVYTTLYGSAVNLSIGKAIELAPIRLQC